ncbi:3-phosphoshikimate 1-carboxyvinyltransferase [Aerococcus urinaehominis]|uniref:3-phosphoshikimate 1-carboxyvinyltransferase n=1 Tax=Aerococcus urinaehominis TaxID=128944 RepID=A0A0X8FM82_9LACT|nr:3-phosphoshikimate 1-carboxyvinyltransferase [Aerococcus urinaehominis]AMB99860.1 3-phosphoshikimate 1-carboxyvinyltransferase [Aerococcus urinaehominis]SDM53988.1 3-phosphoshikimate 1-carboxyvinyltransferase [Aerococcus urinaehominis]
MKQLLTNSTGLTGTIQVPGDKSISHRAVMFGALAQGETRVTGFLKADDCLSTISIFRQLGVDIQVTDDLVTIKGRGLAGLTAPTGPLDCGNSGTTMRLMSGILAGADFDSQLVGDASLSKRPMTRVPKPLSLMGGVVQGQGDKNLPPLKITGGQDLTAIHYDMPVASAQVKSAILLAGLQAEGETVLVEKERSRDHTERMLAQFGVDLDVDGKIIKIKGGQSLTATDIAVPGDISSAAFFIAAALIIPGSDLTLTNVGTNPTRAGILAVAQAMGGQVDIDYLDEDHLRADIRVRASQLQGIEIAGDIIPTLIDELPIIALMASQAQGQTVIRNAEELRVKETDRIEAVVTELSKLGVDITGTPDGMIIEGPCQLKAADLDSYHDHRIGMMAQIAALLVKSGEVNLAEADCVSISYPDFYREVERLND